MAQRSYWSGAIQFGPHTINVTAYPLLKSKSGGFKNLCPCHKAPVQMPKVCSVTREEMDAATLLKGIEVARGDVREIDAKAIEQAEKSRVLQITARVKVEQIGDLLRNGTSHYNIAPDEKVAGSDQGTTLLWNGLRGNDEALIVDQVSLRAGNRPTLAALVASDSGLELHVLPYASDIHELPAPTPPEVEQAAGIFAQSCELFDVKLVEFEHGEFTDTFAERRAELVAKALAGEPITVPEGAPAPKAAAPDLMAALAQALENAGPVAEKKPAAKKPRAKKAVAA